MTDNFWNQWEFVPLLICPVICPAIAGAAVLLLFLKLLAWLAGKLK